MYDPTNKKQMSSLSKLDMKKKKRRTTLTRASCGARRALATLKEAITRGNHLTDVIIIVARMFPLSVP